MRTYVVSAAPLLTLIAAVQLLAAEPPPPQVGEPDPASASRTVPQGEGQAAPEDQGSGKASEKPGEAPSDTGQGESRPPKAIATAYVASAAGTATGRLKDRGVARARGTDRVRAKARVRFGDGIIEVNRGRSLAISKIAGQSTQARSIVKTKRVSLAHGLVTARTTRAHASVAEGKRQTSGRITGLVVGERRIGKVKRRRRIKIPDIGVLKVLAPVKNGVAALHLNLTSPYLDNPAGTDLVVGVARATARDAEESESPLDKDGQAPSETDGKPDDGDAAADKKREKSEVKRKKAPKVKAPLTGKGYVFPVYGNTRWGDTYGAYRATTGSHQGVDIFADFGSPVLAVRAGKLNRVGTLPISGNRFWLKTREGHSFFYAHLSAFSPITRNGAKVKAGDVLGFVGSTGDAAPTPPHLHFETHPGDGEAVNPTLFLSAWQSRNDVPTSTWLELYGNNPGARPGQLVQVRDFLASG